MERLINILVIDDMERDQRALREILGGKGNIVVSCRNIEEAHLIMARQKFGIVLINVDSAEFESMESLKELLESHPNNQPYPIIITENARTSPKVIRGFKNGAVDFIHKPFNPYLIEAKVEVYKSLYYKDLRIEQLLKNILPTSVLESLQEHGKYSPKRVDNGVILFTDFVDFSLKSKNIKPIKLVKRLENYFTKFDEIIKRYDLEKIKTIGDAYMALAGVTENNEQSVLRTCLAAIEIRDYIRNEREVAKALKKDFWDIRIGIHCGPLVAGIIGDSRYSFDVWGDSVNIAARTQQISQIDKITVTNAIHEDDSNIYFEFIEIGEVPIIKRGGTMMLFQLERIKPEYSLYGYGKFPGVELRKICKIETVDFERMRSDILNKLKSMLEDDLLYHDLHHTLNVEKAVIRLARMEGLSSEETMLVRTAALYHDVGFIYTYSRNELHSVRLMEKTLPKYGYSLAQISLIRGIILATSGEEAPTTLLQEIMCDADHDYLGRADYFNVSTKLREELALQGKEMTEKEWIEFQLNFFVHQHKYYTVTSQNIRQRGKENRVAELKLALEAYKS